MDIGNVCVYTCPFAHRSPNLTIIFRRTYPYEKLHGATTYIACGHLPSSYAPLPRFVSFGVARVKLCCFTPPSSSTALPRQTQTCSCSVINGVQLPNRSSSCLLRIYPLPIGFVQGADPRFLLPWLTSYFLPF